MTMRAEIAEAITIATVIATQGKTIFSRRQQILFRKKRRKIVTDGETYFSDFGGSRASERDTKASRSDKCLFPTQYEKDRQSFKERKKGPLADM